MHSEKVQQSMACNQVTNAKAYQVPKYQLQSHVEIEDHVIALHHWVQSAILLYFFKAGAHARAIDASMCVISTKHVCAPPLRLRDTVFLLIFIT